ncbi:MAG: hypothetical protein V7646_7929 [Pseudonocardia sp.]
MDVAKRRYRVELVRFVPAWRIGFRCDPQFCPDRLVIRSRVEVRVVGYAAGTVAACVAQFRVDGHEDGLMVETTMHAPTRTSGAVAQPAEQTPLDELKASLRKLLATLMDRAFGLALDKVEVLAGKLDEVAARGGLGLNALLGGVRASLQGRNPIWGAIKGAVAAMSPAAKAALIVALVLALLLLPLTVVLLLLVLIVVAVWAAVRAGSR